jgi:hypothetical protein
MDDNNVESRLILTDKSHASFCISYSFVGVGIGLGIDCIIHWKAIPMPIATPTNDYNQL